jgi:hypothetical protein
MKNKKLILDKSTLVRLQSQQLSALEAGTGQGESKAAAVDPGMGALAFASCCRKTCNNGETSEPEVGTE